MSNINSYERILISIGTGSCGIAAGAEKVLDKIRSLVLEKQLNNITLREVGCIGMCYAEVLVEVEENNNKYLYGNVDDKVAEEILINHVINHKPYNQNLILLNYISGVEYNYLKKQKRIVLRNCGIIDPLSLKDYLERDGYKALQKVLTEYSPQEVIELIKHSGLRGRGGAGFLTGLKWELARKSSSEEKYVICNADEGDPGAFMDRSVCEGDPHSVIEGMMICGYAIGAKKGYIYCRAEYPKAIKCLQKAIADLYDYGLLGRKIYNTDFTFDLELKEGAGAFVCGEETALIASIEGKRGMPKPRPPYPVEKGLWGKATNINNVETFANVPWIILNGAEAFANLGSDNSKGTKVFAIAGKVKKTGLVEVPMGITIREIIYDICGGISNNRVAKAIQIGGPSGGCLPATLFDTAIDYEQLAKTGAIMGSGGMIVMDDTTCMVEMARYFLDFTQKESCGKCTSCRIGTLRMLEILNKIVSGNGTVDDLHKLEELANHVKNSSLCGLGQTAPNPVLTTLKYFKDEYEAHIKLKKCPAHVCSTLVRYVIDSSKCVGCNICYNICPIKAINGSIRKPHFINTDVCIKCGKCLSVCKFNAIYCE